MEESLREAMKKVEKQSQKEGEMIKSELEKAN